ncbi:glutaminyl-peptide cyclotransferase [Rhodococcoides kyotonense]|uniref:Glutamine cyclotransferase n=1 Tax=Rhodococcoides kyotonense TaxID=398843 RepID=A0A239EA08_9NOCA|nr:glutaminyl-peptide cyclotransferase [Rhodococcus kyotonensis]SNS41319.1 Glutamine cyclotransferase [Rhodococcus kyotonensis]
MTVPLRTAPCAVVVAALLVGCSTEPTEPEPTTVTSSTVRVVATTPHDVSAFTQGLEISGNELYEGTGRTGSSYVRVTSLDTGEELRRVDLSSEYFGEGLTVSGDTVWQITWRDGVAFDRDPATLRERRQVNYDGEGWGLCDDGDRLVMSDGSSTLTLRDPETFDETGSVAVTMDGEQLGNLNELECADDGSVYANIWQSFDIARIDPDTGVVTEMIDASPLWNSMTADERAGADVLNGIAQIPGTDRFLVTGKLWPTMFEVQFTPQP